MRAFFLILTVILASGLSTLEAAVLAKDSMWPKGKTLNILFLDGKMEQKQLVESVAPLWVEGINLKLEFFENNEQAPKETHIRISFKSETGSMLGDHGEYLARTPTLLLSELNRHDLNSELARRYILHEFGHALGFEHEFLNPSWPYGFSPIQQQIDKCIPRLREMKYLEEEARSKCQSLNKPLTKKNSYSTVFDKHSIMNYPLTVTLADKSKVTIYAKTKLSTLDMLAMERWYGKSE